jgi:hypothetical protein
MHFVNDSRPKALSNFTNHASALNSPALLQCGESKGADAETPALPQGKPREFQAKAADFTTEIEKAAQCIPAARRPGPKA